MDRIIRPGDWSGVADAAAGSPAAGMAIYLADSIDRDRVVYRFQAPVFKFCLGGNGIARNCFPHGPGNTQSEDIAVYMAIGHHRDRVVDHGWSPWPPPA